MAESAEECILRQFLGVHHIGHLTDNHGEDTIRIAAYHFGLSLMMSFADGFHDLLLC